LGLSLISYNHGHAAGQNTESKVAISLTAGVSEEITLAVTVTDRARRPVNGLAAANFAVFEDGKPQAIFAVSHEDGPVSIGLLLDSSGSTREKRDFLMAAMLHLALIGNPGNEMFVVNFADEPYMDLDFTSDLGLVRQALQRGAARGGTAMYDAVGAAAEHLKRSKYQKRAVVVVVADGPDNESRWSHKQAIQAAQYANGPAVYLLAIPDEHDSWRTNRELEELAKATGGIVMFPKNEKELKAGVEQVMQQIRSQYTITYKPENS